MSKNGTLSQVQQIEALDRDDTHVRIEKLPIGEASADAINETVQRVRNAASQITNRLRKKDGRDYRVESLATISPDRTSVLCMAVTTRIEDEEEIDI